MTFHLSLLAPGVLLLLFPADRLLSSRVELRSFDCFHTLGRNARARPWWWVPALWLDPVRAFVGACLLQRALELRGVFWTATPKPEYALCVAVLAVGVAVQTFTRRDRGVLLAPLGFVTGLLAALTPWPVALIGAGAALLGLFAFRQFHAYFAFGLFAVAALGVVLNAPMMWIVPGIGAFALPIIISFLTGGALELPTRNSSTPARASAAG